MLVVAGGLVLATAVAVSANASSHLEDAAKAEAVSAVEAIVHAYVDPLMSEDLLASPDAATAASINHQLELLTGSGSILRIKVWSPNGTVVFSDLPALRGRTFEIESDLAEALEGHAEADISALVADENVFERGLAARLLEIYLPIRELSSGQVLGAYEIYEEWFEHKLTRAEWRDLVRRAPGMRDFRTRMFTRLVPNLRAIGLVPPRMIPRYAKAGLLEYMNGLAADRIVELLNSTNTSDRVIVISFDHVVLKGAAERHKGLRTEAIIHARHADLLGVLKACGASSVSIELDMFRGQTPPPSLISVFW